MQNSKFYETEVGHRIVNPKFWSKKIKEYLKAEERYLLKSIKPNSVILDVGCSEGKQLKLLAGISKKIFGIDDSKSMAKMAKEKLLSFNNVEIFFENAKEMHFQDNYFDYSICMFSTFSNIPRPLQKVVLGEMKRVTKNGGKIIISVYSENVLETQKQFYNNIDLDIVKIDNDFVYTQQGLISERFTKKKLENLFSSVDLKAKIVQLNSISYICEMTK